MNYLLQILQQFSAEQAQQAINLAKTFDRNSVPLNKLRVLDDCADIGEKICRAMKELDTDYLKTVGIGLALLGGMQCQQEEQNRQGGAMQ